MKAIIIICCSLLASTSPQSGQQSKIAKQADPTFTFASPLSSRITSPPDSVRQRYRASGHPLAIHELSETEHAQLENVLLQLPAFSRQVFTQHVRSISFADEIAGNGTTIMEDGNALAVFDIVLRTKLLNETVSQFLTRKERGYYTVNGSNLTLAVEAGSLLAVLYVLLHESVHVLDISNRRGKAGIPQLFSLGPSDQLVDGIWENATTHVVPYQTALLQVGWFGTGPKPIDTAEAAYRFLAQTPFVSMYASSNWYDDAAELITCFYLTERLHQPYRIVLSREARTVYVQILWKARLCEHAFLSSRLW